MYLARGSEKCPIGGLDNLDVLAQNGMDAMACQNMYVDLVSEDHLALDDSLCSLESEYQKVAGWT